MRDLKPHHTPKMCTILVKPTSFSYKTHLLSLRAHMQTVCGQNVMYSWKEHLLMVHLQPWLDVNQRGLALYSEQASESIHKMHKHKDKFFKGFEGLKLN